MLTEKSASRRRTSSSIPNILTVATGIEEHNNYAVNFIEATRRSRRPAPASNISGGVRNISFSFRGNDLVREAMHSAFLYHAIQAGLDMGIVNAGQLAVYEDIPQGLLELVEDVLPNRRPDATERLVELAETVKGQGTKARGRPEAGATAPVEERLQHALLKGIVNFIETTSRKPAQKYAAALDDHRRAADGRHERRRRSVRRRQDVPAAGGEERARDEEGRRLSDAVHGSRRRLAGDGGSEAARQDRCWPPSRATSTTSARTSSASCSAATTTRSSTWA